MEVEVDRESRRYRGAGWSGGALKDRTDAAIGGSGEIWDIGEPVTHRDQKAETLTTSEAPDTGKTRRVVIRMQ